MIILKKQIEENPDRLQQTIEQQERQIAAQQLVIQNGFHMNPEPANDDGDVPWYVTFPLCIGHREDADRLLEEHRHEPTENHEWKMISDHIHNRWGHRFNNYIVLYQQNMDELNAKEP